MKQASVGYRQLGWLFAKIGASSFGGWAAAAAVMERELVGRRHWLEPDHLRSAVASAQMIPGATQVSMVAHIGYRLRGAKGAWTATVGYLSVPMALVGVFAVVYFRFLQQSPNLMGQLDGVIAALGGVILANAYRIGAQYASKLWLWGLVGVALFARLQFNLGPLLIIGLFASGGLLAALIMVPASGRKASAGRGGNSGGAGSMAGAPRPGVEAGGSENA